MVAIRLRIPRLLRVGVILLLVGVIPRGRDLQQLHVVVTPHRAGGELLVAAPAASYFLPWMQMDLREMGRVIGVESWFIVRR
jgi:hypothetical protein